MASTPIADLYERYKIGTKKVVQWLADTASKDRDVAEVISLPHDKDDKSDVEIITLSTKQLTRLAEHISANTNTQRDLPPDTRVVISILEDVITHRGECAEWYRHKVSVEADEKSQRSRACHLHFVEVLRTILRILKELLDKPPGITAAKGKGKTHGRGKKGKRDHKTNTTSKATGDVLQNIFEGLKLEEPSDADTTTTTLGQGAAPVSRPPSLPRQFELEPQEEDADFALFCLLKECHEVRLWVRKLWEEYAAGQLSIQIAAEVADNACVLIEQAVGDFIKRFPKLSTFEQIADHLSLDVKVTGKIMHKFAYDSASVPTDSASEAPAEELLCMPAFLSLATVRKSLRSGDVSSEEYLDLLVYIEQQHPFTRKVSSLITELTWRQDAIGAYWRVDGVDIFTSTLLEALLGDNLGLHAVIQFQMNMDIFELCEDILPIFALCRTKQDAKGRITNLEDARVELSAGHEFSPHSGTHQLESGLS